VHMHGRSDAAMHRKKSVYFWYNHIFWVLLLAGVAFFVLCSSPAYTFSPFTAEKCADYSKNWKRENGASASLMHLRGKNDSLPADGIRFFNRLPSTLKSGTALNFRSKNVNFKLSVDGKTVYTFSPNLHNLTGKSYGSCFHCVPLKPQDAGKTVVLTAYPAYSDNSGFFNLIQLGSSGAYYHAFLRTHIIPYLMCMTIIILGIIMLALSLTTHGSGLMEFNMQWLGTLAILLGTWSSMQTLVPQMLYGSAVLFHGLNYLLLILLPYPAIQFTNSLLNVPRRFYPRMGSLLVATDFIVCALLNYCRILDFHESLPLVHLSLLFTVVLIGEMFFQDTRYCRQHNIQEQKRSRPLLTAFFFFLTLSLLDLARYVFTNRGADDVGYFMRLGMLLFFVILFVHSFQLILRQMKLAGKAEAIRRVAYTDALTGIPNRSAFLKKERELNEHICAGSVTQVLVCQFDINDLKLVNDTYGHASGDRHIRAAADALTRSFGKYGACFRVGGDEFTAFLLSDNPQERYQQCYAALIKAEYRYNHQPDIIVPLRIACGQAVFSVNSGMTLEQAETWADRDMYETKRQMKAAAGDIS
jgi:diguanylate cyclase (GGDEF)-like protein